MGLIFTGVFTFSCSPHFLSLKIRQVLIPAIEPRKKTKRLIAGYTGSFSCCGRISTRKISPIRFRLVHVDSSIQWNLNYEQKFELKTRIKLKTLKRFRLQDSRNTGNPVRPHPRCPATSWTHGRSGEDQDVDCRTWKWLERRVKEAIYITNKSPTLNRDWRQWTLSIRPKLSKIWKQQ